jgi:hypothetical protein
LAVFITLETDAFQTNQASVGAKARAGGRAGTSSARRPLRGLEVKDDTYAIIRVIRADGTEIPLVDSGTFQGTGTDYSNFMLQSVQEARMEKHQIVETFGEPYIFFFGEAPRFLDVQAVLINSNDFNWEAEWWENYNRYFRGTKLVEIGARCYLFYDDNVVEGYMLQAQAAKISGEPLQVQLQFRLFVTGYQNISLVGDPNFPLRTDVKMQLGNSGLDERSIRTPRAESGLIRLPDDSQTTNFGTFDPRTGTFLLANNTPAPPGSRLTAARDLVVANEDEWTGPSPFAMGSPNIEVLDSRPTLTGTSSPFDPNQQDVSQLLEVDDLPLSLINGAGFFGADIASAGALLSLGVGPSFGFGVNGLATTSVIADARVGFVQSQPTFNSFAIPGTAAAEQEFLLLQGNRSLERGRQQPYGSLDALVSLDISAGVGVSAGVDAGFGGAGFSPVIGPGVQRSGPYLYNTPFPRGQSGIMTPSTSFPPTMGIGGGAGISSLGVASAFSCVAAPGAFIEADLDVGF